MRWYAEALSAWKETEAVERYAGTHRLFGTSPCALSRRTGLGRTMYISGYLGEPAVGAVLEPVPEVAGVGRVVEGRPEGVEAVDLFTHVVLLNHTAEARTVEFGRRAVEVAARAVAIAER
jgi:hypothetical protein